MAAFRTALYVRNKWGYTGGRTDRHLRLYACLKNARRKSENLSWLGKYIIAVDCFGVGLKRCFCSRTDGQRRRTAPHTIPRNYWRGLGPGRLLRHPIHLSSLDRPGEGAFGNGDIQLCKERFGAGRLGSRPNRECQLQAYYNTATNKLQTVAPIWV
jgi:hypothetical protein